MPEEIQEPEDIRTAKLRPVGSIITMKTPDGWARYELVRDLGWKLIEVIKETPE